MTREAILCGSKCNSATGTQLSWQLLPRFSNTVWKPTAYLEHLSQECICRLHFWSGKSYMSETYPHLRTFSVNKAAEPSAFQHLLKRPWFFLKYPFWALRFFSPASNLINFANCADVPNWSFSLLILSLSFSSVRRLPFAISVFCGKPEMQPFWKCVCEREGGAFYSASTFQVDCKEPSLDRKTYWQHSKKLPAPPFL